MNNFFKVKTKFEVTNEDGNQQKVSKTLLVDAMSFTECEARVVKYLQEIVSGEFMIKGMSKATYSEVTTDDNSYDYWYEVKYNLLHMQDNGKIKKEKQVILINAETQDQARDMFLEAMKHSMVDFEDIGISVTDIEDVIFVDVNEILG